MALSFFFAFVFFSNFTCLPASSDVAANVISLHLTRPYESSKYRIVGVTNQLEISIIFLNEYLFFCRRERAFCGSFPGMERKKKKMSYWIRNERKFVVDCLCIRVAQKIVSEFDQQTSFMSAIFELGEMHCIMR